MPKKSKKLARAEYFSDKALKAFKRGDLQTARKAFTASMSEYENLINKGRADLRADLAKTRMNFAVCLANLGEPATARPIYEITLNEYQALIEEGKVELRPDLAKTRTNFAICLRQLHEFGAARAAYQIAINEYEALIADGQTDELLYNLAIARTGLNICLPSIFDRPSTEGDKSPTTNQKAEGDKSPTTNTTNDSQIHKV
jgi:tetratricopeptide (TPR) repeat protein